MMPIKRFKKVKDADLKSSYLLTYLMITETYGLTEQTCSP